MLGDLLEGIWRRLPKALRRCAMRLTQTRFTVTAAGVIFDEDGRVLLLKHRFRPGGGWGIPGGFIEANEQPEEAIRREILEEVGMVLNDIRLSSARTFASAKQIEIVFRCRAEGVPTPQSAEISTAAWFSVDDLPEGLPRDQQKLIKDALRDGAR